MRNLFFFFLPLSFAIVSCSNQPSVENKTDSSENTSALRKDSVSDWRALTESWTASLDLRNASIMKSFYADSVLYYGDKISGDDVVERQKVYFEDHQDYKMKIAEYIGEDQQPDGSWRIRLTKAVTLKGVTQNYPASLVFAKRNGIWKIISESDDITDLKKAQPINVNYEPDVITVEGLVEENFGFTVNTTGGDPKSDNKENYNVIWPSQPLNVIATPEQEKQGLDVTEKNIDRVQLIGDNKMISPMLNKKVRVTGTLTHGVTAHHFTKVLMNVTKIEEVK